VTSAKIQDGTIASADLSSTPGSEAVDTANIRDSAVTSAKILDGTIASADLSSTGGSEAVNTANIRDLAVTTAKIAGSAVTSGKIQDGTIASADLSSTGGSEAVATANIQANAVTSTKIANDAVNTAQVADASTSASVGLKKADIGLTGSFTVTPGANINNGRCTDFPTTVNGVAAGDQVILNGPTGVSTTGYGSHVVSTAANQITVRICNLTGANAGNGVAFGFTYISIH